MSAFTLLFAMMSFTGATDVSIPCNDIIIIDTPVMVSFIPTTVPNITCSQCIKTVNTLKNETAFLSKIAQDVEYVCGKIFGPAAHECVNVTDDIRKGLDYLSKHNATEVCRHLHYCS
jgi:hypothetical protein